MTRILTALRMAAMCAFVQAMPAGAETIVQSVSAKYSGSLFTTYTTVGGEQYEGPAFQGFDVTLGTLNRVELDITGTQKIGTIAINRTGFPQPVIVTANDIKFRFGSAGSTLPFTVSLASAAGVVLDPYGARDIPLLSSIDYFGSFSRSAFDGWSDVTNITLAATPSFSATAGPDVDVRYSELASAMLLFTLTYDYAPAQAPPAVPELATWAMFAAGFALSGATLRRRRRVDAKLA